jgi:hypothetical protein
MAVKLTSVKCPECGAALQIENGREQIFCSYCGAKILITNENEYIIRHVDDAGVKKAETERIVEMKKLEIIEKNRIDNEKKKKTKIKIMAILAILAMIFLSISDSDKDNEAYKTISGFFILAIPCVWFINRDRDELDFGDKIRFPHSLKEYNTKSYLFVESILKSVGFTNIKTVPLNDLTLGIMKRPDMVEYITINGKMPKFAFKKYHTNASIVISYHSYRKS